MVFWGSIVFTCLFLTEEILGFKKLRVHPLHNQLQGYKENYIEKHNNYLEQFLREHRLKSRFKNVQTSTERTQTSKSRPAKKDYLEITDPADLNIYDHKHVFIVENRNHYNKDKTKNNTRTTNKKSQSDKKNTHFWFPKVEWKNDNNQIPESTGKSKKDEEDTHTVEDHKHIFDTLHDEYYTDYNYLMHPTEMEYSLDYNFIRENIKNLNKGDDKNYLKKKVKHFTDENSNIAKNNYTNADKKYLAVTQKVQHFSEKHSNYDEYYEPDINNAKIKITDQKNYDDENYLSDFADKEKIQHFSDNNKGHDENQKSNKHDEDKNNMHPENSNNEIHDDDENYLLDFADMEKIQHFSDDNEDEDNVYPENRKLNEYLSEPAGENVKILLSVFNEVLPKNPKVVDSLSYSPDTKTVICWIEETHRLMSKEQNYATYTTDYSIKIESENSLDPSETFDSVEGEEITFEDEETHELKHKIFKPNYENDTFAIMVNKTRQCGKGKYLYKMYSQDLYMESQNIVLKLGNKPPPDIVNQRKRQQKKNDKLKAFSDDKPVRMCWNRKIYAKFNKDNQFKQAWREYIYTLDNKAGEDITNNLVGDENDVVKYKIEDVSNRLTEDLKFKLIKKNENYSLRLHEVTECHTRAYLYAVIDNDNQLKITNNNYDIEVGNTSYFENLLDPSKIETHPYKHNVEPQNKENTLHKMNNITRTNEELTTIKQIISEIKEEYNKERQQLIKMSKKQDDLYAVVRALAEEYGEVHNESTNEPNNASESSQTHEIKIIVEQPKQNDSSSVFVPCSPVLSTLFATHKVFQKMCQAKIKDDETITIDGSFLVKGKTIKVQHGKKVEHETPLFKIIQKNEISVQNKKDLNQVQAVAVPVQNSARLHTNGQHTIRYAKKKTEYKIAK